MSANGNDVVQITFNEGADDRYPTWGPRGEQIVYISTENGDNDLYIMNADGSGAARISVTEGEDWSPWWWWPSER
jgi:Tol biopolymer transport system component